MLKCLMSIGDQLWFLFSAAGNVVEDNIARAFLWFPESLLYQQKLIVLVVKIFVELWCRAP